MRVTEIKAVECLYGAHDWTPHSDGRRVCWTCGRIEEWASDRWLPSSEWWMIQRIRDEAADQLRQELLTAREQWLEEEERCNS